MAIERRLGTEENPDIIDQGKSIEIEAEAPTFDEQLMEALEVTISEDGITIGEEEVEEQEEIPFDANLVEYLDNNILGSISKN